MDEKKLEEEAIRMLDLQKAGKSTKGLNVFTDKVASAIKERNIISIVLDLDELAKQDHKLIAEFFQKNKNIHVLEVYGSNVESFKLLGKILEENTGITDCKIKGKVNEDAAKELAASLEKNKTITSLILFKIDIDIEDNAKKILLEPLKKHPNINHVICTN